MDSPEHKILTQKYPKLVSCIQHSPIDVAIQLRPHGILSQEDWAFITNPHNGDNLKAIKIVDATLTQVQNDLQPVQVFHSFVSALKAAGTWTKTIVSELSFNKPKSMNTMSSTLVKDTLSAEQPPESGNTLSIESSDSTTRAQAAPAPSPLCGLHVQLQSGE